MDPGDRPTERGGSSADDAVERLLDLAVYAPLGALVALRDDLPGHVRQGRQAVENRVQLARFIGQLVVEQGRRELVRRLDEARRARVRPDGEEPVGPLDEPVAATDPFQVEPSAGEPLALVPGEAGAGGRPGAEDLQGAADDQDGEAPTAGELPIADYQSLAAIHVVQRLPGLRDDELEQVRRFELAHRARRTVLAKIAQLQERAAEDG